MAGTEDLEPLRDAIAGLHALESQLRQQIEDQLEASALEAQPHARAVLAEIEPRLFAHAEALAQRLELLHGRPAALQQALGSVIGTVAVWIETLRSEELVSRMLRDDFVALSLALAQSQLVEATADGLGDHHTASILAGQREALREALSRIEEVLPQVLVDELREAGKARDDDQPEEDGG